jgi:autotransporter-associated beta strand protein
MKTRYTRLLTSLFATSSAGILQAAVYNWNGSTSGSATGTDNTWNATTANWTGAGTVWLTTGSDNDAVFAGTAGTVTIASAVTANDLTFNTAGYTISGGTLTLNGATQTINNSVTATISSVLAGTANVTKRGVGTLVLSGANTISGSLIAGIAQNADPSPSIVNDGILRLANSNAAGTATIVVNGGYQRGRLELSDNISVSNAITLQGRQGFTYSAITNQSGVNTISGPINAVSNGARLVFNTSSGRLTISGNPMTGASGRTLTLRGGASGVFAKNITSAVVTNMDKLDGGTWTFTGSNTHSGNNAVSGGKLIVTSPTGLGTGNVSVSAAANLSYSAANDSPLGLGGNLAITAGGTTPTTLGCAIGSTPTSATINVAGNATITDAAHTIDLFGVPGTIAEGGTYTLVSGTGVGSALAPATAPTLGKVYNNTSFTVGGFTRSATALQVDITALTPLTEAYWVGGLAGSAKVWAVSNGSTSNWAATPTGGVQALVPGADTHVIVAADSPVETPAANVLGADMTIGRLTIADAITGLQLNDDGYTLKLLADGLTTTADAAASSIAAKVGLDGDQAWTLDSANPLTVSGVVSGTSTLTKAGSGTLVLAAVNTHTGTTQVAAGTLSLANANALAGSTLLRDATDTGTLSYTAAATSYNLGGLTGDGSLDAGGNTLNIGGNNQSTEFSGTLSNGTLVKNGTGTLTLAGASDFAGAVSINAGRLTLANSAALGSGAKTLSMQGVNRSLYLANDITLPADLTLTLSSNSGDGTGLNNESGNNSILGNINYSFGVPGLNISSATGTLSIAGDVTLVTGSRTLSLGGASEGDNTVSGDIGENSSAVMPLIKQGTGKWILSGTNTYKGNTTVNGGTLVLASGGSTRFLPAADGSSNKITGTGTVTLDGALAIDLTNASTATSWLLVEVDTLGESYGSNFTVTDFTETSAGSGVWKRTVGSNDYTFTEATGLLARETATNNYAAWLAANPPATGFTTDSDQDGVPNGIENVLGTDPNAFSAGLTQLAAGPSSVSYQHPLNPTIASDISYGYEWSTDLVEWLASGATNSGGTTATITPGAPVSGVVTVTTSITAGSATKLFTRIKATQP